MFVNEEKIMKWGKHMEDNKQLDACVDEIYTLMPKWHTKIERPFKEMLQKMSLETYVCLLTLQEKQMMTMSSQENCICPNKMSQSWS